MGPLTRQLTKGQGTQIYTGFAHRFPECFICVLQKYRQLFVDVRAVSAYPQLAQISQILIKNWSLAKIKFVV